MAVINCGTSNLTGRVCLTNYEQRQPHDYIDFPSLSKQGISQKVAGFYATGMSLSQISRELNRSKNYIRKTLMNAGVELRPSCRFPALKKKEPKKYHTGVAPFGYRVLRGQLILDAREIQIVQLVMNLWTSGKSYCAIAKQLNVQKIKNRKATPWDHSLVRSIVKRHKDKQLKLQEKQSWELNH